MLARFSGDQHQRADRPARLEPGVRLRRRRPSEWRSIGGALSVPSASAAQTRCARSARLRVASRRSRTPPAARSVSDFVHQLRRARSAAAAPLAWPRLIQWPRRASAARFSSRAASPRPSIDDVGAAADCAAPRRRSGSRASRSRARSRARARPAPSLRSTPCRSRPRRGGAPRRRPAGRRRRPPRAPAAACRRRRGRGRAAGSRR